MGAHIYYRKERELYKSAHITRISFGDAQKIADIVIAQTGIKANVKIGKKFEDRGSYNRNTHEVLVCDITSVLVICHELAHAYQWQILKGWGHNRTHKEALKLIIDIAKTIPANAIEDKQSTMAIDLNDDNAIIEMLIARR